MIDSKQVCWPPKGQEEIRARNFHVYVPTSQSRSNSISVVLYFDNNNMKHLKNLVRKVSGRRRRSYKKLVSKKSFSSDWMKRNQHNSRRIERKRNGKKSSSSAAENQFDCVCNSSAGVLQKSENETRRKSKQQQTGCEGCFCEKGDVDRGRWKWPCLISWLDSIMTSRFVFFFFAIDLLCDASVYRLISILHTWVAHQ